MRGWTRTHLITIASSLFFVTWLGCGPSETTGTGGAGGTGGPLQGLQSIDVVPADATIYITDGVAGAQDYMAVGHFNDGSMRDITNLVAWSSEMPIAFFPQAAHAVASGTQGGATRVLAAAGTLQGAGTLKIIVRGNHITASTPADAMNHFGGSPNPSLAATVVYPADGVLLPANLGTLEFQWAPAAGTDLYDLYFTSPYMDYHVYTTVNKYTPTAQEWTWLSETHRGSAVTYSVRSTITAGGGVGTTAARTAQFSLMDVKGGLYYWSATSADTEGIWRFDFGGTNTTAEKYWAQQAGASDPPGVAAGHCVACHTVTRDGTKMAFTYDGGNQSGSMLDVATRNLMIPYQQDYWNFATFNPDGTVMVTSHDGVLTVRDGVTGVAMATVPTSGRATHPDWSADGNHLVYAQDAPGSNVDWAIAGGSIYVVDYTGGTWSAPRALVQSQGENNYYPSFSPDGQWVLFNRAASSSSYNNAGAEIWVIKADGSAAPFKLVAAHDGAQLTDSWPRWSPFVQQYGSGDQRGPLMWITVSSKRAYGIEMAANTRPQVWMFGFAPARMAAGMDASFPAFWLPFQNLGTNNHIAQWTTRVIPVGIQGSDELTKSSTTQR
jgi:hypothetical protein